MPRDKVRLALTHDALNRLQHLADKPRGKSVQVPKDDLKALLLDQQRLIKYVGREHLEGIL